jgi:glutathione S-transferase
MSTPIPFVELEVAEAAKGLRLVVAGGIPSPWSEAAKAVFRVKDVPHVLVRLVPGDKAVRKWTRARNVPVAMYDDEPARTGWADILELAERIGPSVSLVPERPEERVRMFGLAHEVLGEGGLVWSGRILTIHEGLRTEGARGFPTFVAGYLGPRYGYSAERVALAKTRVEQAFSLLRDALGKGPYYFGDRLTALDLYSAAAMNTFDPFPEELCPMMPPIRAAFESMKGEISIPGEILEHRQRVYEQHMGLPIAL